MVRYDRLYEFIETLVPPPSNLRGENIPESITRSLQSRPSRSSLDDLCKRVYELEKDERRQQLLDVLKNVGDVPQSMVGYDIREVSSVDKLGDQVSQLPRLATVQDENQEDQNVLREYNNLRDQIIQKCKATEVAHAILDQSDRDLKTIESLLRNLPDPERFFKNYRKMLEEELKMKEDLNDSIHM